MAGHKKMSSLLDEVGLGHCYNQRIAGWMDTHPLFRWLADNLTAGNFITPEEANAMAAMEASGARCCRSSALKTQMLGGAHACCFIPPTLLQLQARACPPVLTRDVYCFSHSSPESTVCRQVVDFGCMHYCQCPDNEQGPLQCVAGISASDQEALAMDPDSIYAKPPVAWLESAPDEQVRPLQPAPAASKRPSTAKVH